jgi:hypothetical protein
MLTLEKIEVQTVPVPRQISSSCGVSVKILIEKKEEIEGIKKYYHQID